MAPHLFQSPKTQLKQTYLSVSKDQKVQTNVSFIYHLLYTNFITASLIILLPRRRVRKALNTLVTTMFMNTAKFEIHIPTSQL